ncbi:MAG: PEP-CTERM sorting domain-containing protein [Planctomycetota bacterium]
MNTHTKLILACTSLALAFSASTSAATSYNVDWMQLAPTPFGSPPPFSSSYNLPGIGTVQMSYTAHPDFAEARLQVPQLASGTLNYGGDTYSWTNQETLARTNWGYSGVLNSPWQVTYTFPNTVPAGQLILGVQGLGRRDAPPGTNPLDYISVATVLQNGTHLGDWTGSMNVGPTLFTPAAGSFTMMNSLSGPGGQDPWWNTGLALVRIDDAVSSLTVNFDQTAGDGVGVNIGSIIPEPGSMALLATGGLLALLRRRGS